MMRIYLRSVRDAADTLLAEIVCRIGEALLARRLRRIGQQWNHDHQRTGTW